MKLLDFINKKTDNAYKDFKLVSVIFDSNEKLCTFKFLYKDSIKSDDKDVLSKLISEYLSEDIIIDVKLKKAYVDEDLVRTIVSNYISKNLSKIAGYLDKEKIKVVIQSNDIDMIIKCTEFVYNYFQNPNSQMELYDYVSNFFFSNVNIEYSKDEEVAVKELDTIYEIDNSLLDEEISTSDNKLKYAKVDNIDNIVGEVSGVPIKISSITKPMEDVEVAGEVIFVTEKNFESKRKDGDGNPIIKTYYSFSIKDSSGKLGAVLFPTKGDFPKVVSFLKDGMSIIAHGNIEEFNGRLNFKIKSFGVCRILPDEPEVEEVVEIKKEPREQYVFVHPEPYIEIMQDNLFSEKKEIGTYLYEHDVVVFDIETTGLDALKCEILEIGAVKLHNGKISETFETLVCPKGNIPDEITDLTGIDYDMVKDAPNIKQVLPDFYKFCYGTTIMAYNIDFDYKFINIAGTKQGYIFDMPQIDALYLARAYVPGLKNFKLGTVCKKLGVSLENAHRAVHDATATAEVVILLSPNIT